MLVDTPPNVELSLLFYKETIFFEDVGIVHTNSIHEGCFEHSVLESHTDFNT